MLKRFSPSTLNDLILMPLVGEAMTVEFLNTMQHLHPSPAVILSEILIPTAVHVGLDEGLHLARKTGIATRLGHMKPPCFHPPLCHN